MNRAQVFSLSLCMGVVAIQSAPARAKLRSEAAQENPKTQSAGQQSPPSSSGTGTSGNSGNSGTSGSSGSSGIGSSGTSGSGASAEEAEPYYSTRETSSIAKSQGGSGANGDTSSSPGVNDSSKTDELLQEQTRMLNKLYEKVDELEKRLNKIEKKRQ